MTQTNEIAMLPFKVLELVDLIMAKKKLSTNDALFYLYNSDLYHDLVDEKQKLWYCSGMQLYDFLEKEKSYEKQQYRYQKKELQFFVFCIEQYRLRGNVPSARVLEMFIHLSVDKFIMDNFEVLHSQSVDYILHEIDVFIRNQG